MGASPDTAVENGPLSTLGADGSWTQPAASRVRVEHGLQLIDAAARACGVYGGRWISPTGGLAVVVTIRAHGWLVFPVDTGWAAAHREGAEHLDPSRGVLLERRAGERHVPTVAWGRLLGDFPIDEDEGVLRQLAPLPTPLDSPS